MKKKFLLLWSGGVLGAVLILPYVFDLQREVIARAGQPLWLLGLVSVLQTVVLLAVAVWAGLKVAGKINLPVWVLWDTCAGFKKSWGKVLQLAVPLGVGVAVIIKVLDFLFIKNIPNLAATAGQIPFWKNILVAFYGGIVEELLMRLLLVSLLAWLIAKIFKIKDTVKSSAVMGTAIILAAVLFGLGHLPATAGITVLTPLVVFRAILLNGIGGLVFGWLYWRKGLEYAVVAHFTADIFLIGLLPLLIK